MGRISFYFHSKAACGKAREALKTLKNPPGYLFRADNVPEYAQKVRNKAKYAQKVQCQGKYALKYSFVPTNRNYLNQ